MSWVYLKTDLTREEQRQRAVLARDGAASRKRHNVAGVFQADADAVAAGEGGVSASPFRIFEAAIRE